MRASNIIVRGRLLCAVIWPNCELVSVVWGGGEFGVVKYVVSFGADLRADAFVDADAGQAVGRGLLEIRALARVRAKMGRYGLVR